MGDRTALQMQVITDDAALRVKAREVYDEYCGSDVFEDDWYGEPATSDNVWRVASAEASCGSANELACALDAMLTEEGKDLAYLIWEDPKYEWLGDLHIHVPGLEEDFRADCDSNGNALLTQTQVAHLVESAKAGENVTDKLLLHSGATHYAAWEALRSVPLPRFVATINVPGYLPMDDDPPTFDTAAAAWEYLAEERKRGEEDEAEDGEGYSATVNVLEALSRGGWENVDWGIDETGLGSVVGPTPGGRMHDLGLAYSVSIVEED